MKGKVELDAGSDTSIAKQILQRVIEAAVLALCEYAAQRQLANVDYSTQIATMVAVGVVLAGLLVIVRMSTRRSKVERASGPTQSAPLPTQFESLRRSTKCPFARMARLVGCSLAGRGTLKCRVARLVPLLTQMTKEGGQKRLDGFILHIPVRGFASNLSKLSRTVNGILRLLAENDPTGINCFANGDVIADDWQFSFNGTRFFVTTFAPFYGHEHSRFSGRKDAAFIYFQPEYSFDHHGISAANPDRERLKERVRRNFDEGGIEYSVALVQQPIEAYKYVKPLRVGDPPVEWWNAN